MSIDELRTKIQNRDITKIYIELQNEGMPFTYPLRITDGDLHDNEHFNCYIYINRTRYMCLHYDDYMIKFWTKGDKSE